MRNSMLCCLYLLPTYVISSGLGNHALWLAMNTFYACSRFITCLVAIPVATREDHVINPIDYTE